MDVVINFESSSELVPATSEDIQSSSSAEDDKYTESRNEKRALQPLPEAKPSYCERTSPKSGASSWWLRARGDIGVRMNLLNAVKTLLNVEADKVEILKMAD